MIQYHWDYLAAFRRTRQFGLNVPHFQFSFRRLSNPQRNRTLVQEIYREPLDHSDLDRKCMEFNLNEIPSVIKAFGVKPVLTTGSVFLNGDPVYQVSSRDLKEYLQGKRRTDRLPVHVWLTLPSMEIIDLTLAFTLRPLLTSQGLKPDFILASPAALKRNAGLVYKPMLVGHQFYEEIGVLQWKNKELFEG